MEIVKRPLRHPLRRALTVTAVLLAVPALSSTLSSCGFDNPTDRVYTPSVGVNDRSGSVDVLHALIVSGTDGEGTFIAGLSNNDASEGDRLTGIAGAGDDAAITITGGGPVDVPAGGFAQLADEGGVPLEGEGVAPGAFVSLTLTFERGETITVEVPVVDQRGDYEDIGE